MGTRFAGLVVVTAAFVASPSAAEVFVGNAGSTPNVVVFDESQAGLGGNVAPIRELSGAATKLVYPNGVTVDVVNGELYVADFFGQAVRVYDLSADGDVAPKRELIDGASSGLAQVRMVAVDLVHDELFTVSIEDEIRVFSRTASGDAAPLRTISGALTQMRNPQSIAYDPIHEEIIVSSDFPVRGGGGDATGTLLVFPRTATGNVAPSRVISGPATQLGQSSSFDAANDEIVAVGADGSSLVVHRRSASGNVAPLRTIAGAATGLQTVFGLTVDGERDLIWVAQVSAVRRGGGVLSSVLAFDREANGDVAPLGFFFGGLTGLDSPGAITTDVSVVFADGFETNDASAWDSNFP